ncbi:MAG: acyl carrier protein [Anaerofustis sp.]
MVFEKVVKIIRDYKEDDQLAIQPESTFADLGLDSLDTVELVMNLENEFGTTIELNEDIKTVGDIVAVIEATRE